MPDQTPAVPGPMRRLLASAAAMFVLIVWCAPASAAAVAVKEIYEQHKASVVLIQTFDHEGVPLGMGSGFYFAEREIATNFHVVAGASRVMIKPIDQRNFREIERVAFVSPSLDLALLAVEDAGQPAPLSSDDEVEVGLPVVAIGNPRGLEGSLSAGIVSGLRGESPFRIIQTTAPISPGSSGGPLFDDSGHVIGITTATLVDAQNINFAIPIGLIDTLKEHGERWDPVPSQAAKRLRGPERGDAGVEFRRAQMKGPTVTFSLTNKTRRGIRNIDYVIVFRDAETGDPLHYEQATHRGTIGPMLAKMSDTGPLHDILDLTFDEAWASAGRILVEPEFRLLGFDYVED